MKQQLAQHNQGHSTMRPSLRRHWPILLIAIALAESAHAPLIGGALAAEKKSPDVKRAETSHAPIDPPTRKKLDWTEPPVPDKVDPEQVKKHLAELSQNIQHAYSHEEIIPPKVTPTYTPESPSITHVKEKTTTTLSLLKTGLADPSSGDVSIPGGGSGGNKGAGGHTGLTDPYTPPTSVTIVGTDQNGSEGFRGNTGGRVVVTGGTAITTLPEPSVLGWIAVAGTFVASRRQSTAVSRRVMNDISHR